MVNIRSAKQMDLDRIETIYNHIHDEEEKELRMDTNMINQRARKMYHNLGY